MSPNEITTLIATELEKEMDIPFKLQLMERVRYWRSRLIANSLQKNPAQREFFKQTLYVKLEATPAIPCGFPSELVSASTELPQELRIGTVQFDYVGGIDGKSPFQRLTAGTANYLSASRFYEAFIQYEFINRKVIVNRKDLPLIRVDGIYHDPQKALEYSCGCAGKSCDSWNEEFPIPGELLQLVVQSIMEIDFNRKRASADTISPEIEVNNNSK
jgi:hypothetical protein